MNSIILDKILDAIDKGINTKQLREDYKKYILSGKEKKIVINTGGEGLKVSYPILEEMKKRGDKLAEQLIEKDNFYVIDEEGSFSNKIQDEYYFKNRDKQWTYLESPDMIENYDRENKTLIEILEETKLENIGGWDLMVVNVPVEEWAYEIENLNDHWRSERVNFIFHQKRRFRY